MDDLVLRDVPEIAQPGRDRLAIDCYPARTWLVHAAQRLQQGALARAARADHRDELARQKTHRHGLEDGASSDVEPHLLGIQAHPLAELSLLQELPVEQEPERSNRDLVAGPEIGTSDQFTVDQQAVTTVREILDADPPSAGDDLRVTRRYAWMIKDDVVRRVSAERQAGPIHPQLLLREGDFDRCQRRIFSGDEIQNRGTNRKDVATSDLPAVVGEVLAVEIYAGPRAEVGDRRDARFHRETSVTR